MGPARSRPLGETYRAARLAARSAGVTRLADVTGLAGLGQPVFQAIRPFSRSLSVSQGKGASPLAARVSALIEATELACAERLPPPDRLFPLAAMPPEVQRLWSGPRDSLALALDPHRPRGWVEGRFLATGTPIAMPWDLLSFDLTLHRRDCAVTSNGLATGNTASEATMSALGELLEHDMAARFERLSQRERRALQIDSGSITDTPLRRALERIAARGFTARLWSQGQDHGIAAIACVLFPPEPPLDGLSPVSGSACHPDPLQAALSAVREAVQARAALIAGTREDLGEDAYVGGAGRAAALAHAALAYGDGPLAWSSVPAAHCPTAEDGADHLHMAVRRLTDLPVAVFDHLPPGEGFHVLHALAPGLLDLARAEPRGAPRGAPSVIGCGPRPATSVRRVVFAGPSIAGLSLPQGVAVRPPAVCGDLAALVDNPPEVVGLVDGYFGIAPSVWHKEILALMARGVRVMGAASLGALRAAELHEAGMIGIGTIFEAYRSGAIARDDAVMLLHGPAALDYAALTLPLVDAEWALLALPCERAARRAMQRIVRTMPYDTRSWRQARALYRDRIGADFPLSEDALSRAPSLKRLDAGLLLDRMVDDEGGSGDARLGAEPPATLPYRDMLTRRRAASAAIPR